jgi:hypothetical protein
LDHRLSPTLPNSVKVLRIAGFSGSKQSKAAVPYPWSRPELKRFRKQLIKVRRTILGVCADGLAARDHDGLVRNSLECIMDAYDDWEVRVITDAESECARRRSGGSEFQKDHWPMAMTGGLSALLLFVGHCAKEIVVGTFSQTAEQLVEHSVINRLENGYFALPHINLVDKALDDFWKIDKLEAPFWRQYGKTLSKTLASEFTVKFMLPVQVPKRMADYAMRILRPLVATQAESIAVTGRSVSMSKITVGPFANVAPPIAGDAHDRLCLVAMMRSIGFSHGDLLRLHNRQYPKEEIGKSTLTKWLLAMVEAEVLSTPASHKGLYTFRLPPEI